MLFFYAGLDLLLEIYLLGKLLTLEDTIYRLFYWLLSDWLFLVMELKIGFIFLDDLEEVGSIYLLVYVDICYVDIFYGC